VSVSIVCVGKLREKFYQDAAKEYLKRLIRLMPVSVVEIPDEKEPANPSEALCEAVMRREGENILRHIPQKAYVVAMCIEGKMLDSEKLAQKMADLFTQGKSDVVFVIGGSLGLHPSVVNRADFKLSMSPMTFPHQLARVMLLEQLFRAAKINANERYHK